MTITYRGYRFDERMYKYFRLLHLYESMMLIIIHKYDVVVVMSNIPGKVVMHDFITETLHILVWVTYIVMNQYVGEWVVMNYINYPIVSDCEWIRGSTPKI
jgi:hypothetical protein